MNFSRFFHKLLPVFVFVFLCCFLCCFWFISVVFFRLYVFQKYCFTIFKLLGKMSSLRDTYFGTIFSDLLYREWIFKSISRNYFSLRYSKILKSNPLRKRFLLVKSNLFIPIFHYRIPFSFPLFNKYLYHQLP